MRDQMCVIICHLSRLTFITTIYRQSSSISIFVITSFTQFTSVVSPSICTPSVIGVGVEVVVSGINTGGNMSSITNGGM